MSWGRVPTFDTEPAHRASHTVFTQAYSNYDKAFQSWIGDLRWNDRPLMVIFASPQRAFAQVKDLVRSRPGPKAIPLLFASISRIEDGTYDPTRFVEANLARIWEHPATDTYAGTRRPTPINMVYQVDVWSRNVFDLDWVKEQLFWKLRANEFYLTVDHPFPIGERWCLTTLEGIRSLPVYSDPTKKRKVRMSLTFTVRGWRCYRAIVYGKVETITTDFYKSDDLENLTEDEDSGSVTVPSDES